MEVEVPEEEEEDEEGRDSVLKSEDACHIEAQWEDEADAPDEQVEVVLEVSMESGRDDQEKAKDEPGGGDKKNSEKSNLKREEVPDLGDDLFSGDEDDETRKRKKAKQAILQLI